MMISLKPNDWKIRYSPQGTMPKRLTRLVGGGWFFDFGEPHYITTSKVGKLQLGQTLSMVFEVVHSNDAIFEFFGEGSRNANVRFYLDRGLNNRWWSNPVSSDLDVDGTIRLDVPLDPASWSNVVGRFGTYSDALVKNFTTSVTRVSNIGVTFGGGWNFGHGVKVINGKARFCLVDYRVF